MHRQYIRWKDSMATKMLIIIFFVTIPLYCLGGPTLPLTGQSWVEQWDVLRVIISTLFFIVAFFLIRTLNKFDKNQDSLFDRMREAEAELAVIKDRCDKAISCIKGI